ncbi:hypothetical protein [Candidatus Palauibacter sp.]|uniref:hypothetical protein n=1 Tax=Candidatus Palauibacter sp. TaxID=3101350 RepID=UPI003B02D3C8
MGHYRHPDSLEEVVVTALGGKLYEAYTGVYYDHAREIQVDHIVAKGEAHDSGACTWSLSERRAFAHDVENLALATPTLDLGVKAGSDAAEWLPNFNRCWFAVVAVRLKYGLTVDEAERDALEGVLADCDSTELILTAESWTVEAMTLGDESGWQAVSPNEADLDGLGVASRMAVFCTSTFVRGLRVRGPGRAAGHGRRRLRNRASGLHVPRRHRVVRAAVADAGADHRPPVPPLGDLDGSPRPCASRRVHRRADPRPPAALRHVAASRRRASVAYEGGANAGEKILDALQRCTGGDGDVASLLSGLSGNPTAIRVRP